MADKRISQLIERTDIANNDVLPIVASGATTTNKVTISTIQDWMQDNLDVGVTSVGITLGTTGTDVNVSGSPITTSGNITINIPDASASARGVVTTGSQNFAGNKSFQNTIFVNAGLRLDQNGTALPTFVQNISGTGLISSGSNGLGFNSANNLYFSGSEKGGAVLAVNNSAVRTYTLQDANGTLAFTSDLTGYVTLGTAQTITAQKTFSTSGSSDTAVINHGSGSGIALNITKAGNGEGLRVAKTSGSGNAVTITGGTLSAEAGQFSGDLQTSTRISATSGSNAITITPNVGGTQNRIETTGSLPLSLVSAAAITMAAGGTTPQITLATTGAVTLTGALNGTSATFAGGITLTGAQTIQTSTGNLTLATAGGNGNILLTPNGTGGVFIGTNSFSFFPKFLIGGNATGAINVFSNITSQTIQSDVTNNYQSFRSSPSTQATVFTLNTLIHFQAIDASLGAGSLVTNQFGFASNIASGSGKWNLYMNGTANNYLAGNLLINTTTDAGFRLDVNGTARVQGAATFSSSVTAASFVVGNGQFYRATRSSGSLVTDMIGIPSGTDDVRILSTGDINFVNGSLTNLLSVKNGGNVGIGTASPASKLDVSGEIRSTSTSGYAALLSISALGYSILADTHTGGAMTIFTGGSEKMRVTSDGYQRMAAGTGGIQFNGDTAAANALDDYEEGTWTPVVQIGSTINTASVTKGRYTKIGNVVYIQATITGITKSGTGNLTIAGLPFTVGPTTTFGDTQGTLRWDDISSSGVIYPYFSESNTFITMQDFSTTGYVGIVNDTQISSSYQLYGISGFYMV
jgi:hypothetical protein